MKQMLISLHDKPHDDTLPQKQGRNLPAKATWVKLPLEHEEGNVFVPKPTLFVSTNGSNQSGTSVNKRAS